MTPFIIITRYPYEEPYHLRLVIEASNGRLRGLLEFYTNSEDLARVAERLETFPVHLPDDYSWELGSERAEDRFAHYFLCRVFTTDRSGHCAIQLRFNNNAELPHREVTEFCLLTEASEVTRLGKLFRRFAKLEDIVLHWSPSGSGAVYPTLEDAQLAGIFEMS
jgi:hypothetical protein